MVTHRWFRFTFLIALLVFAPSTIVLAAPAAQLADDPVQFTGRMVTKAATVSIVVRNCRDAMAEGIRMASSREGYTSTSELTSDGNRRRSGKIVLRIPAVYFEDALADLRQGALRVEREELLRSDVIEQYNDLAARLEGRKLIELRYTQVLHSAKQTKELLDVEEELTRVRDDVEHLAAEQKSLSDRVKFSTITVRMHEPVPPCRCRRR